MTEVTENSAKQPYTIEEGLDKDGVKIRIIKNPEGSPLFSVPDSFTDEQIEVVYSLSDSFFITGMKLGITRLQHDFRRLIGLEAQESAEEEK